MSDIKMKVGYICSNLQISHIFIDDYLANCPPVYPLIYIWSLRRLLAGETASVKEISERFSLTEGDVIKAWQHWENEKLIRISSNKNETEITFLPVQPKGKFTQESAKLSEPVTPLPESRPQYTAQELACYRSESKDVERVFSRAERVLGKLLAHNDMHVIFSFYDWLRLPIEVIEYLLVYCEENGHRNLRYIEKCAIDWADNDIQSLEQALEYVQNFDRGYREILRHLGQTGYPAPTHRKYMKKWLSEWNMPLELITEACDRCIEQIGKSNFKYIDKIITGWHKDGVLTLDAVTAADESFAESKVKIRPISITKPKPNRFTNFKQSEVDYEKLEREYREQKYGIKMGAL